jgi:hypothetical protein
MSVVDRGKVRDLAVTPQQSGVTTSEVTGSNSAKSHRYHVTVPCLGSWPIHLSSWHDYNNHIATLLGPRHPNPSSTSSPPIRFFQRRRDDTRNPIPHARDSTRRGLPPHAAACPPHAAPLPGKSRRDTTRGERSEIVIIITYTFAHTLV